RAVKQKTGIEIERVNIGGGFGVPYRPEETTLDLAAVGAGVRHAFDEFCGLQGSPAPMLMIEPGRLITPDAGFLGTRVNIVKAAYRTFVGGEEGMNDFPRPSMYGAYHHISVLGKEPGSDELSVNVVGRLCENNDQFARDRLLPPIAVGDVLVLH